MTDLRGIASISFGEEMVAHLRQFSPPLCETLTSDQLGLVVETGRTRAAHYGLTLRGPIRLFLELMFLFGVGFEDDPQYPWASETLRNAEFENQMFKAGRLEFLARNYVNDVHGPENEHAIAALRALEEVLNGDLVFRHSFLSYDVLSIFKRVYPIKLEAIGASAAETLVQQAHAVCRELLKREDARAIAMIAILKFCFGMRCVDDPSYPWIGETLRNPRNPDPAFRARSLERKAILWLRAVNHRFAAESASGEGS